MAKKEARLVFELTLEDRPPRSWDWPAAPVGIRLKRLLKVLLRSYGFKCIGLHQKGGPGKTAI